MRQYLIELVWKREQFYFLCEAENKNHAVEQCENAYNSCKILKISKVTKGVSK